MYTFSIIVSGKSLKVDVKDYFHEQCALSGNRKLHWISYAKPEHQVTGNPEKNRDNGILIVSKPDGSVEISTDHFGSLPLFYAKKANNIFCSNVYWEAYNFIEDNTIDTTAFWEMVLFEMPLCDRTILKSIRMLSLGATLVVAADGAILEKKYWNLSFPTIPISDEEECAEGGLEVLVKAHKAYSDKSLVFPMGGGVDCRLSAAALSKVVSSEKIFAITYGYSPHILEYTYAKQCAEKLGFSRPVFHKLSAESYIDNIELMNRRTGCLVSAGNCHFLDFLCSNSDKIANKTIVSNMYSDAVCGWDAQDIQPEDYDISTLEHLHTLQRYLTVVPDDIIEAIRADIASLAHSWRQGSSLTSLQEYIYVHERNAKFHLVMSDLWRTQGPVVLPFSNWEVAAFFFGLPNRFRLKKRCSYLIFEKCFPELKKIGNISSAFRFEGLGNRMMTNEFRVIHKINAILRGKLRIPLSIINRYETEDQAFNLAWDHRELFLDSIRVAQECGLISSSISEHRLSNPNKINPSVAYQIISNIEFLRSLL